MSTIYKWSTGTPGMVPLAAFDELRRVNEQAIADLAVALNTERAAHAGTRDHLEAALARVMELERKLRDTAADRTDPDLVECAHCRRPVPYSEAEPVDGIDGPPAMVCAACAAAVSTHPYDDDCLCDECEAGR